MPVKKIIDGFETGLAEWKLGYYPPGYSMQRHRHERPQLTVMLVGCQTEISGKEEQEFSTGMAQLTPNNFYHSNRYGKFGSLLLTINIKEELEYCFKDACKKWTIRRAKRLQYEWKLAAQQLADRTNSDNTRINEISIEMLTCLTEEASDKEKKSLPPKWLIFALEAIIETDHSITRIAKDIGVHRVHLCRCFKQYYSTTISEFRRHIRLSRAINSILAKQSTLSGAAVHSGFSDQSHLTRELKKEAGFTPGQLVSLFQNEE